MQNDTAILEADVRFDAAQGEVGLMKYVDGNNAIRFTIKQNGGYCIAALQSGQLNQWPVNDASSILQTGKWYHLKGLIRGTVATLYLDGKLIETVNNGIGDIGN